MNIDIIFDLKNGKKQTRRGGDGPALLRAGGGAARAQRGKLSVASAIK